MALQETPQPVKQTVISTAVSQIKNNPDYFGAVLTSYAQTGLNMLVQVLLVPLYLACLGKYQFGILMILLSFINYAAIGTGWMAGGMLRLLAEYVAREDEPGFARGYALSKILYVGYAAVIAAGMLVVGLCFDHLLFRSVPAEHRTAIRLSVLAAAVYFVALYDFSVDRMAFAARQKQFIGNLFQILSLVVFAATVIPWLLSGGTLGGVLICLLGSVVFGRVVSWWYWRRLGVGVGWRRWDAEMRPLLKRLIGPMGLGYLLYGVIVLTLQADVMVVAWLGGPLMAAEFVLVWKIAELLIQMIWRIPESLQPYLIAMDARGETERLRRIYRGGAWRILLLSFVTGAAYAAVGPWIVRLWVGRAHAPHNPMAFVGAGAAIFWLASARLPVSFAYAMIRLRDLNLVAGMELLGKLALTVLLFPLLGYLAPLVAISVVYLCGVAWAYWRLVRFAP